MVIESVLPRDWIAALDVAMENVLQNEEERQNGENPMLKMPFMDPRIIDNPFAMAIMKAVMGEKILPTCLMAVTQRVPVTKFSGFIEIQGNFSLNYRSHYRFQQLSLTFRS